MERSAGGGAKNYIKLHCVLKSGPPADDDNFVKTELIFKIILPMLQTAVNCGNCSSDGSGNNAEHSQGKLGNFVFEVE